MKLNKMLKGLVASVAALFIAFGVQAADVVAKVGNTEYATIDEAIANWTHNTTLTLLADVTLTDVIKLSSTEYHVLDLGTYTMTAASRKDAIQIVNNGRTSASYALDIKADATNPGGITATGKAVVKTTGKSGVKDRPIIRFYNGVFNGSNIIYHSGSNGTNCPQFWFYGGEFNGTIYSNRSLNQFFGGTFNGSLQMSVDSSAYALISGGRFKKLDNQYGSALNTDKFTIGSAKGTFDKGVYVDKEGYFVVGGSVITELSAKYRAKASNASKAGSYLPYSSAAENGLFYEDAAMAIAKHGEANVTIWVKPAVTIPENVTGDIVEEIKSNTALKDYTPENLPQNAELEIELKSVGEAIVYDVTPMANGAEVEPTEAITFRLPVPASVTELYAKVSHKGTLMGIYAIKGEGNAKYVELSSADFSEFTVEPVATAPVAAIGNNTYATLQDAVVAATDGQTVKVVWDVVLDDVATVNNSDGYAAYVNVFGKSVTIDLCGRAVSLTATADKYISCKATMLFAVFASDTNGSLTLKDSEGTGSVNVVANGAKIYSLMSAYRDGSSSLIVESGSYTLDSASDSLIYSANDDATIVKGGSFALGNVGAGTNGKPWIFNTLDANKRNVIVEGGTFNSDVANQFYKQEVKLADGKATVSNGNGTWTVRTMVSGSGTEADPYVIDIKEGLAYFRDSVNNGETTYNASGVYVKLGADIDLNDVEWAPIGTKEKPFKGIFDGNDKTVSNLTVTGENNVGFFGYADACSIKNLKLANVNVSGKDCVGAVAGQVYSTSTIDNCHVSGNIKVEGKTNVGGIVGKYYVKVSNSSVIGDGIGTSYVKGVYDKADLEGDNVGGIMGHGGENNNFAGNTVKNITISGTRKVGGIVGTTNRDTDLSNCTVQNVKIETTATADYAASNASSMDLGGLIGHYYNSGSNGKIESVTVSGVTFDTKDGLADAGAVIGGDRGTSGAPAGNVTVSGVTVSEVTGATQKYLLPVAKIGEVQYLSINEAFSAAVEGESIVLLDDVTPALTSQRAITKAAVIDLNGKTLTLTEDDLYFGTTTFKNGTIVVDPTVNASTAVFWMFENQTLTFDNVDIVATGVTGTYLIGINGGTGSAVNIINGSSITIDNASTAGLTAVICDNGTGNSVNINGADIDVKNIEGRFYLGGANGSIVVKNSDLDLTGVKEGFYLRAGQSLDIAGTSEVDITLNSTEGRHGINVTDLTAIYTKADTATVNATLYEPAYVAKIGSAKYATLQTAVNAVKNGDTITLVADITENVTLTEKIGLYYTIDGNGKKMEGTITISSLSDTNDNRRITIKNINFVTTEGRDFITSVATNHYPRITVEGCSFTGTGNGDTVAIRLKSSHSVIIKGCTGTGLHSFLQNTSGWYLTVENVTVSNSKSGFALGTVQGVTVKGCNIDVAGYGVRMDAQYNNNATLESNTIKAFIPVVVRKASVDSNVTVSGANTMTATNTDGLWFAIGTSEYETNGTMPTAATGKVRVTVNDAELNKAGVYGSYKEGTNSPAYTKEESGYVCVWGEGRGNATYSYVLKLFSGENLMATTTLNNIGGIIDGDVNVTWNFYYPSSNDEYWTTVWEAGHPNSAAQPTKVELWIDGVMVSSTPAKMSGADDLNPVVWRKLGGVAVADLEGEGTEAAPYLINNLAELKWFRGDVNAGNNYAGKYVKLTADIDLGNEEWAPIGFFTDNKNASDDKPFKGVFDGQDNTISNLKINKPEMNAVGFFAYAESASVKNLNVVNAEITGYSQVAAIVGRPYSGCTISNCHVSGTIAITAKYAYAAGIAGYGYLVVENCSVIGADTKGTITAEERNAVGGITAWLLEGSSKMTNCHVKNMALTGWTNVGGLTGFLHYNGVIDGCSVENVDLAKTRENGHPGIGWAAGGWSYNPSKPAIVKNSTFKNITRNGQAVYISSADVMFGSEYSGNENKSLTVENNTLEAVEDNLWLIVSNYGDLVNALARSDAKVRLDADIIATATQSSGYGKAGIVLNADNVLDGNGKTLTINGAGSGWDCAIAMKGGEVRNLTIAGAFRGVFMPGANGDVVIDNCVFKDVVYTFNSDAGSKDYDVTIKNTTLNGWTSFSDAHKSVTFENCSFGEGSGYAFCRPYQGTTFTGCSFAEGFELDAKKAASNTLTFDECTYAGQPIDTENGELLFSNGGQVLVGGNTIDFGAVAKIGDVRYATLQDAFNAATSGCIITLLDNVTISEAWDNRYTGAKFTVPVTIEGNGKKITFKGTISDGYNYLSAFRFESAATVKNLTIDMSEAVSGWGSRLRAISAKGDLTVDNCTFIGNAAYTATRAIIFGEGERDAANNIVVSITNSRFINWTRGVGDNENGLDAKSVALTGNKFENSDVAISASENITFTGNTMDSGYVSITSYSAENNLNVVATGNTLAENGALKYNAINAGGTIEQEGFFTPVLAIGSKQYFTLQEAINKAANGAEIDVLADIALTAQNAQNLFKPAYNRESYCGAYIPDDKAIVLDLNGHTVSYVDTYGDVDNVMILNLGDLTVNDSVGGGKLTYKPVAGAKTYTYFYSTVFNCGKVTVNAGTIENTCETAVDVTNAIDNHSRLSHEYGNDCELVVNGGTLSGAYYYAIRQYTHYLEGVKNRVVVNGGSINGGIYMQHGDSWYYADPSKNRLNVDCGLEINGGVIGINTTPDAFGKIKSRLSNPDNNAWSIAIKGGTINVPVELNIQRGVYYANGVSGATVPGETVGTRNAEWLAKNGGFITGGTFASIGSADAPTTYIENFLADAYKAKANDNGTYCVALALAGSGTEDNPYLIANKEDLIYFRDHVNAGKTKFNAPGVWIALGADIDLAGINWVGIGSVTADHGFMGNFDGNGFKVKNLTITNPALDSDGYAYAGLFAVTEGKDKNNQNVIKNLTIENVTIDTTGHIVSAAIAYPYYTIVENVKVCGDISIKGGDYTAGALAYTRRCVDVKDISVVGNAGSTITGNKTVGGVISDIQMNGGLTANYSNFNASGLTITGDMHVGGISGIISKQTLSGCSVKDVALVCSDARVGTVSGSLGDISVVADETIENVTGAERVIGASYKDGAPVEAKVGDTYYFTVEQALAVAKNGDTVTLLADVAADVTVAQAPDTVITIDGNGKNWAGTITVDGKSATYLTAGVTIKNIDFDASGISTDASINLGVSGDSSTRYTCNVTVEDCTFTGVDQKKVAVKSYTGGDKNLVIRRCTVDSTMHSMLQAKGIDGIVVENCTVYSKNGINLNNSFNVEIKNSTVDVAGYAVRAGEDANGSGAIKLTGNTLKTTSTTDAVIVLRAAAQTQADIDMSMNVIEGATHISGVTDDTEISADANFWGADKSAPVVAGTAFDVTTYYKDRELTNLGYLDRAAYIGNKDFATLADAIAAVKNGETIVLVKDCDETVTIGQKNNVKFTIDGDGKTYTGKMTVNKRATTAALTIKNVNFVSNVNNRQIVTIDNANYVTIDGCSFTGNGTGYGIKLENANNNNIVVKNSTASKLFDFVYASKGVANFTAENIVVTDVTNGFQIASGKNLVFRNVNVTATVEGLAFGNSQASKATLENCVVKAERPFRFVSQNSTNAFTVTLEGENDFVSSTGGKALIVESSKAPIKFVVNDADSDYMTNSDGLVAMVGNKYFNNLQKAVDAAADGDTVTVLSDFELTWDGVTKIDNYYAAYVCVAGKAVTIDLNGKKLTGDTDAMNGTMLFAAFASDEGGALTLEDSVGGASVKVTGAAKAYCLLMGYETGCKLTVKGGAYELVNASDSLVFAGAASDIVAVSGGTFTLGNVGTGANQSPWIFNANGKNANSVYVTGGTFNADVNHQYYAHEVRIPETLACKLNGNGTWTIVPAVAYVTEVFNDGSKNVGYATFADAVAAADKQNGGTVTIFAGTYTENLNVNKAVTVVGETDENGNNLVNFTGKVSVSSGATVKNLNVNNTKTGTYDCALSVNGNNIVIEGVKLSGYNGMRYCYATGDITIKNSTIVASNFAVHFDGKAGGNVVFENTSITGWCSYAGTVNSVSYKGCTLAQGNSSGHRYYNASTTFNECTFADGFAIDLTSSTQKMAFNDSDLTAADVKAMLAGDAYYITKGNVTLNNAVVSYVASAQGKYYDSLQAAIDDLPTGGTATYWVYLQSDVEQATTVTIPEGKRVVLNLNGFTINAGLAEGSTSNHIYVFENKGYLAIKGTGTINTRGIFNYGDMVLESGTINAIDCNGGYAVRNYNGASFEMNGGLVATTSEDGDAPGEVGAYDATTVRVDEGATFEMNGGEIKNICNYTFAIENFGETVVNAGKISSVHTTVGSHGDIDINGGEFTCNGVEGVSSHVLWIADGTALVTGGTFDGKDNYNGFNVYVEEEASVSITGGKFLNVHSGTFYGKGKVEVSGGLFFDAVPADRCEVGYLPTEADENGMYSVFAGGNVVYIAPNGTCTFYADLNKGGADGYVIKLLADVAVTKNLQLAAKGTSVTLDLNGKTLTNNFKLSPKGSLTVLANGGKVEGSGTIEPDGIEPFAEVAPIVIADKTVAVNIPAGAVQKEYSATQTITTFDLATVDGVGYCNIREAINAALDSGKELILNADVRLEGAITVDGDKSLAMNLGDNTLSGYVDGGALIVNNGVLSLVGGTVDNTDTGRVVVDVENNNVISVNGTSIGNLADKTRVAVITTANGATVSCQTLADAVGRAADGDTVTLLKDVSIGQIVKIERKIALDLGGKTVVASAKKAFEVYADATIRNGAIVAANRCIDTRKAVALTLSGLKLTADEYTSAYGNPQAITIGGYDNGTTVAMENVEVGAKSGYGIITFVETDLAATNCTISGYNALYVKPGSEGSSFEFVKSTLSGDCSDNDVAGNSFAAIAVQTDDIEVSVDADSKVKAIGNNMYAVGLGYAGDPEVTGNTVAIAGTVEGNILATSCAGKNTVAVKAEYTDALEAEGFAVESIGNGMVKVLDAKVAEIDGVAYVSFEAAVSAAQNGNEVKILKEGSYKVPTGKSITITGAVDGVVFDNIGAHGMNGANVTFNNVTFNYAMNSTYKGLQHSGDLVYNNCTFNGQVFLYGTSETFNNCVFNQTDSNNYNVWTYSAAEVEFNGCTFESAGKSVLIYHENAAVFNNVKVDGCAFNASVPVDGKAAIEMDSSLTAGIKLTIANSTVNGFGEGNVSGNSLWNNKKGQNTEANNDITVVVDGVTVLEPLVFVANIGKICYTTITEAINAAQNGDTVTIYPGEFDEKIAPWASDSTHACEKSITIVGADNFGTTLTGGIYLGRDDSQCRDNTITIKGINFEGKGVLVASQMNVVIDGNRFANITAPVSTTGSATANAISVIGKNVNAEIRNNMIDTVDSVGIMLRNIANAVVTGNTVANTKHNAIQVTAQNGCATGSVVVENNILSNWGKGGEGRAVRISGVSAVEVNGNVMTHASAPEEFVKVTGATTIDASGNYWNGEDPTLFDAWGFDKDTDPALTLVSYYTDAEKTNLVPLAPAPAKIGDVFYRTVADALAAAQDEATVELIWTAGYAPVAMNGSVYGKTVTITGNADVDWSKGFLFIGRGGEGNGTVIFNDATLVSQSNSASYGIHVSGREKNTNNKYDGTLVIKNSTIELDYLINKGSVTLDASALTVKNGFAVGGRPANETESGKDATAYMNLINGSTLTVNNHNGMGLGYEALGVMTVDSSSFVCTQNFLVTAKGAIAVANGGSVAVEGTLTNKGEIELAAGTQLVATKLNVDGVLASAGNISAAIVKSENGLIELSGGIYTQNVAEWCVDGYASVANGDNTWTVIAMPEYGVVEDGRGIVMSGLGHPEFEGSSLTKALDVVVRLQKPAVVPEVFKNYNLDLYVAVTGLPDEGVVCGENDYLAGDFGPAGKLFLSLEGMTLTNGTVIPVLALADETLTYSQVLAHDGDFRCGIHLGDSTVDGLTVSFRAGLAKDGFVNPFGDELTFDLTYNGAVAIIIGTDGVEYGPYYTIDKALDESLDGETVMLLTDSSEVVAIPAELEVTLDLNSNTLNGSIIAPNANLTIKNGTIINTDKSVSAIEINAGTLALNNVVVESARHALRVDGAVEVTIDGGKYSAGVGEGTGTYHALNVSGGATVTVDGGEFVGPKGTSADSGAAVNVQSGSTVVINGGTFTGGKSNTLASNGTLTVMGGKFDQDPGKYLPAGYESFESAGSFGVMKYIALDIKVIDNKPFLGYDQVQTGKLVLKATAALDGTVTWTTIEWTKDEQLSTSDTVKDWVAPAEGYRFFKAGMAK